MGVNEAHAHLTKQEGDPATKWLTPTRHRSAITQVYADMAGTVTRLIGNRLQPDVANPTSWAAGHWAAGPGTTTGEIEEPSSWLKGDVLSLYRPTGTGPLSVASAARYDVVEGVPYTFTASVMQIVGTPRTFRASIVWHDSGGAEIEESESAVSSSYINGWVAVSATGEAPDGAVQASLHVGTTSAAEMEMFLFDKFGFWTGRGGKWAPAGQQIVDLGIPPGDIDVTGDIRTEEGIAYAGGGVFSGSDVEALSTVRAGTMIETPSLAVEGNALVGGSLTAGSLTAHEGTIGGDLRLDNPPTDGLHATNKAYVDAQVAFAPLSTWSLATFPTVVQTVRYSNGLWVVGGNSGVISTSSDAVTWVSQTVGTNSWRSFVYANGRWVAVGLSGAIATSTDGATWTLQTVGTRSLWKVVHNNGTWVAVGDVGTIVTSTDGVTWTLQTVGSKTYNSIAYGAGVWIAVGSTGTISRSLDGVTWTTQSVGAASFQHVVLEDGRWMACGIEGTLHAESEKGVIFTSTDSLTWTGQYLGNKRLRQVGYGGGRWMTIGAAGVFTSTDGVTWTAQTINNVTLSFMSSLGFYDGFWVAGGVGAVAVSSDGVRWTAHRWSTGLDFPKIAFGNGLFMFGGGWQQASHGGTGRGEVVVAPIATLTGDDRFRWFADHAQNDRNLFPTTDGYTLLGDATRKKLRVGTTRLASVAEIKAAAADATDFAAFKATIAAIVE